MRDSPWPVVPRPFADEAFGSWFGRLALRYRIDVDELATQADVELDFGRDCSHWLATPTPTGSSLRRLGVLTRIDREELRLLGGVKERDDTFWFCERCFFLNPEDVTAPYWKSGWLMKPERKCSTCGRDCASVSSRVLSRRKNMRSLQHFISKRRQRRAEELARMHPYTRFVRGLNDVY